ncbi:MAG TPA: FkbM family methyltransferase [Edaphobacter sp.]|jgi:FkbM family methyltransferase|nr:FkbM family methyltransferase [Edaphobacter sp.]
MLSLKLANRLTPSVTFVSRHLPELGTNVVRHLHRSLIGHQLLSIKHDGFKILVDPNDNCGGRLYYWGSYEPEQTAAFKRLLSELHPTTFIDVGANIGYYSMLAAAHSDANVYAFEASPRVADCLTQSISSNSFAARIHVVRKAVSKEKGTISFYVNENPHNFGLGSVAVSSDASTQLVVECCSPDEELGTDLGASVLCKMDIEGGEFSALQGMQQILTICHPTLIVEVHPIELKAAGTSARQVYDLLRSYGYKLSTLDSSDETSDFAKLPDNDNFWLLGRWSRPN